MMIIKMMMIKMISRRQYRRYLSIAAITACCCEGLREKIPLLAPTVCIWIDGWIYMVRWMNLCLHRWMDGWMVTRMDGWIDGWMDG